MSNLEDCSLDKITSTEVGSLIGRAENQRLEFKESIATISTYELAKDLASLGNAEGGLVVVGVVQDKGTERCIGFRSVQNAAGEMKKLRDVAAVHIEKPVSVVPVVCSTPSGEAIVCAFVPKSATLLAVTTNKKGEYWKRTGTDKREMTHAEVEAAIRLGERAVEKDRERQRALARDTTRWNEIDDVGVLRELMGQRFRAIVGAERWLRMAATPVDLKSDRINTGDDNLRALMQFPFFGQRDSGWYLGIGAGQRQILPTPLGFESKRTTNLGEAPPYIVLTRSGHFEFSVPLFPFICFGQRERRDLFDATPQLWPMAVVEFPLSFLIFVKELYKRVALPGAFVASVEYVNLGTCVLQAGTPYGMPFFDGPQAFAAQHYGPYDQRLEPDFDPEAAALVFALHLYRSFGYDRKHIPYFAGDKFTPGSY